MIKLNLFIWGLMILCVTALGKSTSGFQNYGVAAEVAQKAWGGPNAVVDSHGNALVLLPFILPSNGLLVIDVETGDTQQFDVDYPEGVHYMRYHVLSKDGRRWYTTVGKSLREFDVDKREWTFVTDIPFQSSEGRRDGRGMLEDAQGVIWIIFSPTSELVSFDPKTREIRNHGTLNDESWSQMPDGLAMDEKGWIYAAIKFQKGNLVAFHPASGERKQLLSKNTREYAAGHTLYRANNGKVYGRLRPRSGEGKGLGQWYELYEGTATAVEAPVSERAVYSQGSKDPLSFPDGRRVVAYSLVHREIHIRESGDGETRTVKFDYQLNEGANIYSMAMGEDGWLYGTTGTPLTFFRFHPQSEKMETIGSLLDHGGHVNDMIAMNGRIYGAVYSSGSLIEYDPSQPWDEVEIRSSRNPKHLHGYGVSSEILGRPYSLHAHSDGRHLIMTGNPSRALAGGGMLIYDTQSGEGRMITAKDLIPDQGPMVVKSLPNGYLVGGTTTQAGTTGTRKAKEAEVFIYDMNADRLVFRGVPVAGAMEIIDMVVSEKGWVYGMTRGGVNAFFVFDPENREVIHAEETAVYGLDAPAGSQGPRMMEIGPDGRIHALFRQGLVRIDPDTFTVTRLAESPVTIGAGIVLHQDRIYFSDRSGPRGGSQLWSYQLPKED